MSCSQCEQDIENLWSRIRGGQQFRTPDIQRGAVFHILNIDTNEMTIQTQNGTLVPIRKSAFLAALHYLHANKHNKDHGCEIRSSNDPASAGPLCKASRDENGDVRCINYIVPILEASNIVAVDGNRPNKTWIVGD